MTTAKRRDAWSTHCRRESRVGQRQSLQVGHQAAGQECVDGCDLRRRRRLNCEDRRVRFTGDEPTLCVCLWRPDERSWEPRLYKMIDHLETSWAKSLLNWSESHSFQTLSLVSQRWKYSQSSRSSRDISLFSFLLSFLGGFARGLDSAAWRTW